MSEYYITDSIENVDFDWIVKSLLGTYWAKDRDPVRLRNSLDNSTLISIYKGKKQIGFARVISDYNIVAYLCDVYIDEGHRGKGAGKALMDYVTKHPSMNVYSANLGTKDAHGLYEKYGFERKEGMKMNNVKKC